MKNLIKKILKEEENPWQWVDDHEIIPKPSDVGYKMWLYGLSQHQKDIIVGMIEDLGYVGERGSHSGWTALIGLKKFNKTGRLTSIWLNSGPMGDLSYDGSVDRGAIFDTEEWSEDYFEIDVKSMFE